MTVTVHHLNESRSQRVLWLLEELQVPYTIQHHARERPSNRAPASLRSVHPLGKSPVITDDVDGRPPVTVAESGAIFEYLLERYDVDGRLRPAAKGKDWVEYLFWFHAAESSVMTPLQIKMFRAIERAKRSGVDEYADGNLRDLFALLETTLATRDYITGDRLSAADIMMSFPAQLVRRESYVGPRTLKWIERMRAMPGYVRAEERGGVQKFKL